MAIIRKINENDIPALIELGQQMHRESAYAFLPYQEDKVQQFIIDIINDTETQCALVAEKNDILIGMIAGYIIDYFFCDELLACDMVLFIKKSHRGGLTAFRLARAFRQWAQQQGAVELSLGISTNIHPQRTGQLYQKMGLKYVGGLYKQRFK